MNPVVLIATHDRKEITSANIVTLQQQSFSPKIVLVVSNNEEANYYVRTFKDVQVTIHPNKPLGAKWQHGVEFVRNMKCSHLIITGSDDILCKDFIRRFCHGSSNQYPFTGFQRWYIYEPTSGTLRLFEYRATQCLGGGRVYSEKLLEYCNWKLFDTMSNKLLDDKGWTVSGRTPRLIIKDDACILAVKGDWPVMNSLDVTLKHRNAKLLMTWVGIEAQQILINKFNYKPKL